MPAASSTSDRVRKVAILVASLDGPLAERLLGDLSPGERRRVEAELDRLDEIDADERALVLAEFRGAVTQHDRTSRPAEVAQESPPRGVEAEFSTASQTAHHSPESYSAPYRAPSHGPLDRAEPALVAQILTGEHPQTIALVLSRIGDEQASAVFALLPPDVQADAVDRISHLDVTDGELLSEIEQQLSERLAEHERRAARMAAGANLAMRMLAKTDPQRRTALLARMSGASTPSIAASAVKPSDAPARDAAPTPFEAITANQDEAQRTAVEMPALVARSGGASRTARLKERLRGTWGHARRPASSLPSTTSVDPDALASLQSTAAAMTPLQLTDAMARLDEVTLAAALRSVGDRTALLALTASGDDVVSRLIARAPRRQASALRKQLRRVGPATLSELVEAQAAVLAAAALHAASPAAA